MRWLEKLSWLLKQKAVILIFTVIFVAYMVSSFDFCLYPSQPVGSDKGFIFSPTWTEHLHSHECYAIYYQTGAFLEGHNYLTVNTPPDLTYDYVLIGEKYYALGEPVPAVMLLPFYAAASFLSGGSFVIRSLMIGVIIYTCISALLLRKIVLQLKQSEFTANAAALLFGFATMAFSYSRLLYPQPIVMMFMLASLVFLFNYKENRKISSLFLFSFFYALTVFSFNALIVAAPIFLYYLFKVGVPIKPKTIYTMALGVLPMLLLFLVWNVSTTGNPLLTTRQVYIHSNLTFDVLYSTDTGTWLNVEGLVGQLFSPVGIFFVSPILLAAFYTLRDFKVKLRNETVLLAAIIVVYWLFMSWIHLQVNAQRDFWVGGWADIARYMYVPSTLLVIFAAAAIQKIKDNRNILAAWIISLLVIISFLANLNYEVRRDLMVGFLNDFPTRSLLLWPNQLDTAGMGLLVFGILLVSLIFPAYIILNRQTTKKTP